MALMNKEEELIVHHPFYDQGLRTLARCIESVGTAPEPECRAFFGPSGSGKSRLAKGFRELHPVCDNPERRITPVAFVDVPTEATVKSLVGAILRSLGDPLWERGNTASRTARFQLLCRECHVRMLMLDDFQHLVDTRMNVPFQAADWLKQQINQTGICVIAFGLDRSLEVLRQNEQLRRRFGTPIKVGPFEWNVKEEREQFRALLIAIRRGMPQFSFPAPDLGFSFRMHFASYGLIGYAMPIIRGAVRLAERRNSSEITLPDLARSFAETVWIEDQSQVNPFSDEFDLGDKQSRKPPQEEPPRTRRAWGRRELRLVA